MIQIRDVPDQVHSILKSRAAKEHMSLSDFLKKELASIAERSSMSEWLARARQTKPTASKRTAAQIVRALRDAG